MSLHLFGIRHHGPGCSRALEKELSALTPDRILLEGPPEGEEVLSYLQSSKMDPPVALLVYPDTTPKDAVFYPFAIFSPEWIAMQYGIKNGIPIQFIDLPWKHRFAVDFQDQEEIKKMLIKLGSKIVSTEDVEPSKEKADSDPGAKRKTLADEIREDPIGYLSATAGYKESESWWERIIEQTENAEGVFTGILEAMSALRSAISEEKNESDTREHRMREAWMRRFVREAAKNRMEKIAVICGAWHIPVLDLDTNDPERKKLIPSKKEDDALISGLPKVKVNTTWCPWSYSRLSFRSGYGAGIESPGWYHHLWKDRRNAISFWISEVARLLRDNGIDVSSANVIEAVRLANTLAVLRNYSSPGLSEVNDAVLSVLCNGDQQPLKLIREKLETGNRIGSVSSDVPMVPLFRDIENKRKSLRLKISEEIITMDLDLRKENDREKSCFLHRLDLLGISWGQVQEGNTRSTGSFHEIWQIRWEAEFVVRIIEANVWGSTLEAACSGFLLHQLESNLSLPEITVLLNRALLAEVPEEVMDRFFRRLQNDAAVSSDIGGMIHALPPLASIIRYGNVRQTDRDKVEPVFEALFQRILVGLLSACGSLDEDAAEIRRMEIDLLQNTVQLLNCPEDKSDWTRKLYEIMESDSVHPLLGGRSARILYEQGDLGPAELETQIGLSISPALSSDHVAQWIQGFLLGTGQTLLHLESLWDILNRWIKSLSDDIFLEFLPLIRRAFSGFTPSELKKMGKIVKSLSAEEGSDQKEKTLSQKKTEGNLDEERIKILLPVLNQILEQVN
ncbi:MAG: DUF5682 family protein [Planctomycetia bacterium]|nr:DUF5682 family protein [Planctomycetia bacterium]